MRDYAVMIKALRWCDDVGKCSECPEDFDCAEKNGSVMREAADAIEELLAAVPKWISVEERLPEVTTKVLTYNGTFVSENWLCTIADKDGKREIWAYSEGFVTHWMPLPSTEGLNEA